MDQVVYRRAHPLFARDFEEIENLKHRNYQKLFFSSILITPGVEPTRGTLFFSAVLRHGYVKIRNSPKWKPRVGSWVQILPKNLRSKIHDLVVNLNISQKSLSSQHYFASHDLGFGIRTSDQPIISVIIPVHNAWATTEQCLRTLQANQDQVPFEIIVVDDASTDQTAEELLQLRGVNVITMTQNVGYLRANNFASQYARGKYLALLNNDTAPLSGWLDSLLATMQSNPEAAIVGSKLVYPNGLQQEAGAIVFDSGVAWNIGRLKDPFASEYASVREVDYCSAAAILVRRDFWESVGGFDEQFVPAYCEDVDLALMAWAKGFRVLLDPDSWVVHYEGVSHGKNPDTGLKRFQIINTEKLRIKWQLELVNHWSEAQDRLEYSRDSKGIVILVDQQLPDEKRDSGSIRTIQLAKTILRLGFHVVIGALDSSSSHAQITSLRKSGIEVHGNLDELFKSIEPRKNRITHFWLIRQNVADVAITWIQQASIEAPVIADLLDLDYEISNTGVVINKNQLSLAEICSTTILVSPFEASLLKKYGQIDAPVALWKSFKPRVSQQPLSVREGLIFVGGFRHLPNLEGLEWFSEAVLPKLQRAGYKEPIYIVGTGLPLSKIRFFENLGFIFLGNVDDLSEIYGKVRIAIIPLRSGRGLKGKLAEALAYGIPIITTSVGAEGFGLVNEQDAIIVDTPEEWSEAIQQVTNNPNIWENLRISGLEFIENNFSESKFSIDVEHILNTTRKFKVIGEKN